MLDTDSISPTASVTQMTNVWREDVVHPSLTSEQVFQNAPRVSDDCFVVRTPLGGERRRGIMNDSDGSHHCRMPVRCSMAEADLRAWN